MPRDEVTVTFPGSGRAWSMGRAQADALVQICGEEVPHGIYAVERENAVELRNDAMAPGEVAAAVKRWASDGWLVHFNL